MIPINAIVEAGKGLMSDIGSLASGDRFDYSQEGLTREQMIEGGKQKAKALGHVLGGPIGKLIGNIVGGKKAANIADQIIGAREGKMEQILQMQRDKQKEMSLFKANDINQINEQEWEV